MNAKDAHLIMSCIDNEGFDYTFVHYTDFNEIKDDEFHKLREAYLDAREALREYLGIDS